MDGNDAAQAGHFLMPGGDPIVVPPGSDHDNGPRPIKWLSARDLAAPLPPTAWKIEGLYVAPGRPHMIEGFGYSGKTIMVQDAALALAAGVPVWGHFPCEASRVKHFDFEMGTHATQKRYQRLALGRGLDLGELGDALRVSIYPEAYLDSDDALDVYSRECEGIDVAVIDALRGATPTMDENDSSIRVCLDTLARVSERTGSAFIVLHHTIKSPGDRDKRQVGRGSGAIFDAAGTKLLIESGDGGALVTMTKAAGEAEGRAVEPFMLVIDDVEIDGHVLRRGLTVRYMGDAKHSAIPEVLARTKEKLEYDRDRVLAVLRSSPEPISQNAIRRGAGMRKGRTPDVLDSLVEDDLIEIVEKHGRYNGTYYQLAARNDNTSYTLDTTARAACDGTTSGRPSDLTDSEFPC